MVHFVPDIRRMIHLRIALSNGPGRTRFGIQLDYRAPAGHGCRQIHLNDLIATRSAGLGRHAGWFSRHIGRFRRDVGGLGRWTGGLGQQELGRETHAN